MRKKSILKLGISLILTFALIQACNNSNPANNSNSTKEVIQQQSQTGNNQQGDSISNITIGENSTSNNGTDGLLEKLGSDANPSPTVTPSVPVIISENGATPTPTPSSSSSVLKNSGEINVLINPNPPTKI